MMPAPATERRLGRLPGAIVVAGALAVPFSLGAQAPADSLLDRAARAVTAARTMRAAFEQTVTNPDIRQSRTSRGEFAQQGAARFAMRFTNPAGDAIVADGSNVWVYLPSSARGQALKLPLAQGAQLDLISQLLTSPRTSYHVSDNGTAQLAGRRVAVIGLRPRVDGTPFTRATLWLDAEHALVLQLEAVELSGLVRRIRFTDIRTDVELPKELLTFAVPPNVKVIDATGLLPARPSGGPPPGPPPQNP
jgi:outer membrane lipoprotein-sorting protein